MFSANVKNRWLKNKEKHKNFAVMFYTAVADLWLMERPKIFRIEKEK